MRRRLLSLLMVFVLLLGMMPVSAFAEEIPVSATVDETVVETEEVNDLFPDQDVEVLVYETTVPADAVEDVSEPTPVNNTPPVNDSVSDPVIQTEEKTDEEEPVEEPVEEKPVEEEPVEEEPVEEEPVEEEPVEEEPVEEKSVEEEPVEEEPVVEELPAEGLVEEETSCLSVVADASTGGTIKAGEKYSLELSDVFVDSEGHALTYSFASTVENQHTKIADGVFHFSAAAGTYEVTLTAKCEEKEVSHKLTITVEAGNAGIAEQYNYNETAANSVKVYVTLSNDGYPVTAKDGTPMSHLEVTVPYFDLALYGLEDYYRYGTANGSGEYINETVIKRPTGLHLYIYLLERYYMGMDEAECGKGDSGVLNYAAETDVVYMDGTAAYSSDGKRALMTSGGPTSLYMVNFWGHDENLMYFRNHCYPYMSPGWGSTSDYILLSDGDTWDVAMFSNWEFHNYGYFARFDQDEYTAEAGKPLTVKTQKWGTSAASAGFADVTGLNVGLYTDEWELVEGVEISAAGNSLTFTAPAAAGTYYLMAMDPNAKDAEDACIAPATAVVTVTAGTVECETCTDENTDRTCDVCGKNLNNLPTLAEGVENRTVLVQTGWAYQVDDLVNGNIFTDADHDSLTYSYRKSSNGGETWSDWMPFGENLEHGGVNKSLSNSAAGIYTYEFKANDGFGDSEARWILTLETRDVVPANVKFYLSQDNNYKNNGNIMPVLELYKTAGLDENLYDYVGWFEKDGKTEYVYNPQDYAIIDGETDYVVIDEVNYELHDYEKVTFTDSLFGAAPAEGETATASGTVVNKYNMFYATILTGRYSTRVYGYNTTTTAYDIYLGGQSMELPMEVDIYGNGGNDIYLRQIDVYTTSKKLDNTYFTAEDYYAEVIMPVTGGMIHSGDPYVSGNYTKFPFFMWAAGNGSLYNAYVYPYDTDSYIFSQQINLTTSKGTSVVSKAISISTVLSLTVTVPETADFELYFQYNNFNTREMAPIGEAVANGDGTKTLTFKVSKNNQNYTWRMTDTTGKYVTRAGWLAGITGPTAKTYTFDETSPTDKKTHSFRGLGTAVGTRDEADLQVFLSATGFKSVSGTTRIRAYRMWEIINSDPGNIMVEPDFNIQVLQGNASDITLSSGGNAVNNWIDVTPTTTDIVAVTYDALDVWNTSDSYGSHGGLFPATNPERTNVFIITNQAAGTAVAHIPFNGSKSTDRGAEWDYNYDTWSYLNTDTQPNLHFTVSAGSNLSVSYAYVITGSDLKATMSAWNYPTADETGTYNVSLLPFRNAGTKGGTIIIKMTDSTGTSYALVRAAEMAATVTNVTTPGEPFTPGDRVSVSFENLYRSINKISGIFNPMTYYLRYTAGDVETNGSLAQYQQMDKTVLNLTIPEDITFPEGQSTMDYTFTNGYVYGSMMAAASPFQSMYYITDTGVGTNFSAVGVSFVMSRLADIPITLEQKVYYDMKLAFSDGENPVANVTFSITDPNGNVLTPDENGIYQDLTFGDYHMDIAAPGFRRNTAPLHLGSADASAVVDGILVKTVVLEKGSEGCWDGSSASEPKTDASGIYQIGTGAELAWFAQTVNAGTKDISAVLTADIDLGSYDWTPIGSKSVAFTGNLDGQNHKITGLYIYSTTGATYQGLFGSTGSSTTISNLTVEGAIYSTSSSSVSQARIGGVSGYANGTTFTNVHANVDITIDRVKGTWANVGGISGMGGKFTNCSNTGDISGYNNVGGLCGGSASRLTACFNSGNISGNQYVGGLASAGSYGAIVACYNTGDITGKSTYVAGITGEHSTALTNCFNTGTISIAGNTGAIIGRIGNGNVTITDNYYLQYSHSAGFGGGNQPHQVATMVTAETMASRDFAKAINVGLETPAYAVGTDHPILTWQDPSAEVLDPNVCDHQWTDATCTTPKTCSVCGATEGEELGHSWQDATCTTPKNCSVCGATDGEANPDAHSFVEGTCEHCGVLETVAAVNKLIAVIQLPVELEDEEAILAAWEAYNALTEEEQQLVSNVQLLQQAMEELATLKAVKVMGGKSVTLETTLTGKVIWSLAEEYKPYASINKSSGKLTAKKVAQQVSVYAVATDAEGNQETVRIDIYPAVSQVKILDALGEQVKTVSVKVNDGSDNTYVFTAVTDPADAKDGVTWTVSDKKGTMVTYEVNGNQITLKPAETVKKGSVTLTATASDGTKKTASVKLNMTVLAKDVAITGADTVASGKSITLKAAPTNANATNKSILWSIDEEDKAFASISSSGKLTAVKNLTEVQSVTVRATAKDGSGACKETEIKITPLAKDVQMYNGESLCSNTKLTQNMTAQNTLTLSAQVAPLGKANQAVTWKSSNSKVASIAVDENGIATVTCLKAGKVTITATADDGSKEKATFTLTVVEGIQKLTLDNQRIAVKKSLDLAKKIQITPASATNKTLKWEILGDAHGATISSKGKLNTKKVDVTNGPVELTIRATAQDGFGDPSVTCTVTVYPATTKNNMVVMHGDTVVGKKDELELEAGKTLTLKGYCEGAANVYTWKSSSKKVTVVDGVVTAAEDAVTKKPINVTITCIAADGTNVKVSVKVKVVAPTEA